MTIQDVAHKLLQQEGSPLSSKEIAKRALEGGLVSSNAKDPVQSHAATIEKNIRDGIYNKPELVFVQSQEGRLVALPEWETTTIEPARYNSTPAFREIKIKVPQDIYEKIQLAEQARLANTLDETVVLLLKKGLSSAGSEIRQGVISQLDQFSEL